MVPDGHGGEEHRRPHDRPDVHLVVRDGDHCEDGGEHRIGAPPRGPESSSGTDHQEAQRSGAVACERVLGDGIVRPAGVELDRAEEGDGHPAHRRRPADRRPVAQRHHRSPHPCDRARDEDVDRQLGQGEDRGEADAEARRRREPEPVVRSTDRVAHDAEAHPLGRSVPPEADRRPQSGPGNVELPERIEQVVGAHGLANTGNSTTTATAM